MPHPPSSHSPHGRPGESGAGDTTHPGEPGSELPVEPDLGTPLVPNEEGEISAPA